ncbi:MAG TPA: cob(I)yrinic acid a,c-diamide adenosyltransferase [Firmicutes bacterium]|nr:cob(I)yrinic acid a,c-diamide adenosyltransferase [Bacillota bacterium]
MKQPGLIQLYCGDGKGKTSAAVGQCLRAAGHGLRIGVLQFLKDGSSGEIAVLRTMKNVTVFPAMEKVKFTFAMTAEEKAETRRFNDGLLARAAAAADTLDVLLLDEVCAAVSTGLLDEEALLKFLREKPAGLEVLLTGRDPSAGMRELADYISEIRMVRHPFEQGIAAREGIEW